MIEMESIPLISIALCTYNGERYLQQQLDSILNQTYKNIELVIVDDHSADGTFKFLEEYSAAHPQIRLFSNDQNLGFTRNFEKAIRLCTGTLIALADQDDIWHPEKLEQQANAIANTLLLYHDSEFIDASGRSIGRRMSDIRNFYKGNDNRYFLLENCVSGHSCLFKKELVEYIFPFPDNVFHDWWLAYIALSYGSIGFLPQSLVKYRQHTAASTDILRSGPVVKRDALAHMQKETERVRTFAKAAPYNADIDFFSKMLDERFERYFCFSLFWFLLKRKDILLFIQKKSGMSKFNFALKYLWGYRLKKLLKS